MEKPKNKFALWFNCQSDSTEHKYWANQEISVEDILKLYDYAMDEENLIKDYKGNNAVRIAAQMFPATSKAGNTYMKMVLSEPQPKKTDSDEEF
tara:strand:- start:3864 stop:4145 length:282 start_codon:yes stop_codon:yes gene_type:complete